ncbi:MAG: sulfotransferase [Proteobacteria bacterium]|nr:sulfotransferase [Pseudomonadota bacterium]
MNRKERRKLRSDQNRPRKTDHSVAADMKNAEALLNAGDMVAAEKAFLEVTVKDPLNAEAFHMLALIAYSGGHMVEAGQRILEATTRNDDDPAIHANCGAIMNLLGRPQEAEAACRHVIDLDPDHAEAHNNLAVSLEVQGRLDEARAAAVAAITLDSGYVEAHINLGNITLRAGDPQAAAESYRAAIAINPNNLMARSNLGVALREAGDLDGAEAECRAALDLNADYAEAHNSLGSVLREKQDWAGAKDAFQAAMVCRPGNLEAHLNLAGVTFKDGDIDGAVGHYRNILDAHENSAEAHEGLGVVLLAAGQLDDAVAHFSEAVKIKPTLGSAQYNLASAAGGEAGEAEITAMRGELKNKRLSDLDRARIHFALGEINHQRGNFETAFADFEAGNHLGHSMLAKKGAGFDADAFDRRIDAIMSTYSADVLAAGKDGGDPSDKPVFIVGLPRSGTTLAEHIIANHPQVDGKGEIDVLRGLCGADAALADADDKTVADKADQYLERLTEGAEDAARITDKTPFNFLHLGQIKRLFPAAHIVHCRRDLLDTGFSCFRQNFTPPHAWTMDLGDIGRYFRAYGRLMEHWRAVMPGAVFELRYEDLIGDQEGTSRKLIDFLGLEWDAACLDFHTSQRPVLTASNWQVRKPLYATAVGGAKPYAEFLGELKDSIAG